MAGLENYALVIILVDFLLVATLIATVISEYVKRKKIVPKEVSGGYLGFIYMLIVAGISTSMEFYEALSKNDFLWITILKFIISFIALFYLLKIILKLRKYLDKKLSIFIVVIGFLDAIFDAVFDLSNKYFFFEVLMLFDGLLILSLFYFLVIKYLIRVREIR